MTTEPMAAAFHPSHIGGSINAPDSLTTALVKKIQALEWAILVCQDGRQAAMVVKTLGYCGFKKLAYLEGGLNAWVAAGGRMVETTRTGFEHEVQPPEPGDVAPPRRGITQILASWLKRDSA